MLVVSGPDGDAASAYRPVRSDEAKRDTVAEVARRRTAERVTVRAEDTAEDVAEAIRTSWADVVYLKAIDEPGGLEATGRAVAHAVTEDGAPSRTGRMPVSDGTRIAAAYVGSVAR